MRLEIVVSVAVVVVALAAAWWFQPSEMEPPAPSTTVPTVAAEQAVVVHVSGAVSRPGLVQVPQMARVADAIAGAGGATPDADLSRINLAAPVADGQQIVVPAEGEGGSHPVSDGPLRINQATTADLELLPGVGPVLAQRIVEHRDQVGGFQSAEDLLDVPGIGEAKLASLRDLIAVP